VGRSSSTLLIVVQGLVARARREARLALLRRHGQTVHGQGVVGEATHHHLLGHLRIGGARCVREQDLLLFLLFLLFSMFLSGAQAQTCHGNIIVLHESERSRIF